MSENRKEGKKERERKRVNTGRETEKGRERTKKPAQRGKIEKGEKDVWHPKPQQTLNEISSITAERQETRATTTERE